MAGAGFLFLKPWKSKNWRILRVGNTEFFMLPSPNGEDARKIEEPTGPPKTVSISEASYTIC